ncbi:MAG: acyl-[acyl-carrier-protein] thioesterase [Lachnospiraceae bacterium]|nr:acyl-[acyl-carrier-protein] thioesterase [Lachnospiraceae bacterium]
MYTFKSRVRFSECDSSGVMTWVALINYLQDCCTMQAEDLDIGIDYLKENNMGWFLTNWDVSVIKMPCIGEEISITTWPYKFAGFIGFRNFEVKNSADEVIAYADSIWILMNLDKQAPTRLPDVMQEKYTKEPALATNDMIRKLKANEAGELALEFVVDKMYLDTNFHMNNSYYVQGAIEAAGNESFHRLAVEYKKSAQYQDVVRCMVADIEGGRQVDMVDAAGEAYAVVQLL